MAKMFALFVAVMFWGSFPLQARSQNYYLFYNAKSAYLDEILISESEIAKIFEDEFGPASEELPEQVRYTDYYVSLFADGSYVFILNAPYNCGRLGCNTQVYIRDEDGDLMFKDTSFPVICEKHEDDKMLCLKGGYKKKTEKTKKKGPVHYPSPRPEGAGVLMDLSRQK